MAARTRANSESWTQGNAGTWGTGAWGRGLGLASSVWEGGPAERGVSTLQHVSESKGAVACFSQLQWRWRRGTAQQGDV